ncbi:31952_t:CDS:1, partial [Racocetra persica]
LLQEILNIAKDTSTRATSRSNIKSLLSINTSINSDTEVIE